MMKRSIGVSLISTLAAGILLVGGTAFAQTTSSIGHGWGHMGNRPPGVFGSVTAVSGGTLTVTSKGVGQDAQTTTYTVDATNATVTKNGQSSAVSAIAVGDTIMAQGTVSGTTVTATTIHDGAPQNFGRHGKKSQGTDATTASALPQGNGQPVIGGTVAAISGNSVTVTNKSNVTYVVDVSSATVTKDNASSSVSNIAIGDTVIIQGAVNGSAITASSVIDHGAVQTGSATSDASHLGFMGGIFAPLGGIFHRIFGFF